MTGHGCLLPTHFAGKIAPVCHQGDGVTSLTELQIRGAKEGVKPKKLSDGHGLMLRVSAAGSKRWALGYRFGGSQRLLGLGEWPAVSLAAARGKRRKRARC